MRIQIIKPLFSLLAGVFLQGIALAQTNPENPRVSDTNHNAWYQYFGDHYFARKWSLHTEIQFRRFDTNFSEPWNKPQQLLTRFAVNYDVTDRLMLSGGYGYIETHPYGDYPSAAAFPEQRIYEQIQLKDRMGRIDVLHRFRQEQRYIKFPGSEAYDLLHRTRYQLKLQTALIGKTIDDREPYVAVYDEIFIGYGKHVQYNVFDQNRLGAAIGFRFTKNLRLEAGYQNQVVAHRRLRTFPDGNPGQVFENNHTFMLGLTFNLDFRKPDPEPIQQ